MACQITSLIENSGSENLSLATEHGLSFLIQTESKKILFDCGAGDFFISNSKNMDISLESLDFVIISHSHYDHSLGFKNLAESVSVENLVTGKGFFNPKYAFDGLKYTYLGSGFGYDFLKQMNVKHIQCDDALELFPGFTLFGSFPRKHEFETIPNRFVLGCEKDAPLDLFEDEICLGIETDGKIAVVVGCSHPGILNMLEKVKSYYNKPIHSVWGGTHLVEADETRILKTLEEMKNMGIEVLGFSHCSGERAVKLAKKSGIYSCQLNTGDKVIL